MIHTVVVSYERPELLERTVLSYANTVSIPHDLVVVDNGSGKETQAMIRSLVRDGYIDHVLALGENRYPGAATNAGFALASPLAPYLHRSDNDMEYLPGWCDEVLERFDQDPNLWQLGLRTTEEEGPHPNVGGNCVFRREAWDTGLRYAEEPWPIIPFEDTHMSGRVQRHGKNWDRVRKPCVVHIGKAHRDDPYYQKTFRERRLTFEMYGL